MLETHLWKVWDLRLSQLICDISSSLIFLSNMNIFSSTTASLKCHELLIFIDGDMVIKFPQLCLCHLDNLRIGSVRLYSIRICSFSIC